MAILTIRHVTRYRYAKPVWFGEHHMMFRPRESFDQHVLDSSLVITPKPASLRYQHDVFGNCVGIARFGAKANELVFESVNRLKHTPEFALDQTAGAEEEMNSYPFAYRPSDLPDVYSSMLRAYRPTPDPIPAWSRRFLQNIVRVDAMRVLTAMTHAIHDEFKYVGRLAGLPQSPAETLELKSGTCRDFAVLMMEAARSLGIAARFVSGYIFTPYSSGFTGGGSTHAWMQAYLPGAGWIDFDPTNSIIGNRNLIRVAVAWSPEQVLPLWGTFDGPAGAFLGMDVAVTVTESGELT